MSGNLPEYPRIPPGLQNILNQQGHFEQQERQMREIAREAEEASDELAKERDEERRRNEEHLKASQTTAEHLAAVTNSLNEVSEALRGVHSRLDQQKADSAEENKKNRGVAWIAAAAAAGAVVVPILLHFF